MASDEKKSHGKVFKWLDERYNLSGLIEFAKKKSVPKFRETIWYYFGGVALLLFVVQVISGILLLMYYKGTEDLAFESVKQDAFVKSFLQMTPAQVASYVSSNAGSLGSLGAVVNKLAQMVLYLAKDKYK